MYQTAWLINKRNLFLIVLETGKSKIQVLAYTPGEGPSASLQMSGFSLYLHMSEKKGFSGVLFAKALILLMKAPFK
jgi:hypothetical protein